MKCSPFLRGICAACGYFGSIAAAAPAGLVEKAPIKVGDPINEVFQISLAAPPDGNSARGAEPFSSSSSVLGGEWLEDFSVAKALAAEQGRHVLLDFTGSDWCGFCIKLDREVFEKPDFKAFSAQSLVLVKLDFPRNKAQGQKTKTQNASLQEKFRVEGFPTIVLLDSFGREVKRWSGFNARLLRELKATMGSN